ncbi:uncharacterized protein B0T15DRAFT_527022 [Chaetomium strumarium]|uniref:Nucleotide-diphospho-sugar transferase domain-containing protein n=1 Tax=Chaetomium strumarium TaxID=1170767 RepID=A0AAJ0GUG7_9PEZI|nr:hypothetical protein B0T15DRAFT_527022 [Chaetomium strumarium]
MAFPFPSQRMFNFYASAGLILILVTSLFYAASLTKPIRRIRNPSAAFPNDQLPLPHNFGDIVSELYKPIKLPVTATSYMDQRGKEFGNGGRNYWNTSLEHAILIVDIDTRSPDRQNGVFNGASKMDWEKVQPSGAGLLTLAHLNHYIYSQIHGYDYKFFHAREMKGHWHTWIKPHVFRQMLQQQQQQQQQYKFVVFLDADAVIQHLEVPLEFLLNRWDISPNTSIAMPIDTRQLSDEKNNISTDSRGKVVLNSGVVVLQNLPYTHDILQAWTECTSEKRYPGCGQWKERWSHEQRAFSEYIRYDFNPHGNNIVEIPCNDANGYPGLFGKAGIIDDCQGEFVRHYTLDKEMTKTSTSDTLVQSIGELVQKNFAMHRASLLIEE